jgi:hypothetical protein
MEVHLHSFLTSTENGDKEISIYIFKRQIVTVFGVLDPDNRGTKILRNGAEYCLNDIPEAWIFGSTRCGNLKPCSSTHCDIPYQVIFSSSLPLPSS